MKCKGVTAIENPLKIDKEKVKKTLETNIITKLENVVVLNCLIQS